MKDNKFLGFKFLDYFDVLLNKTTGNEMYKVSYNVTNNSLPFVLTETNLTNGTVFGLKAKCQYDIYFKKTNGNFYLMDSDDIGYCFIYDEDDWVYGCKSLGLTITVHLTGLLYMYRGNEYYVFNKSEEDNNYYLNKIINGSEYEITINRDENNRITSIVKELKMYGSLKEELLLTYGSNNVQLIYKKYDLTLQYVYLIQDSNKNIINIYSLTDLNGTKQYDFIITRGSNSFTYKDNKFNVSDGFTYSATNKVIIDKFNKSHTMTCSTSKCIFTDSKGEQTTYIFDENGITNHIKNEYGEIQTYAYTPNNRLQSTCAFSLKSLNCFGEPYEVEDRWTNVANRSYPINLVCPFEGELKEGRGLVFYEDEDNSYVYREEIPTSGKREQVNSLLLFIKGNGAFETCATMKLRVDYFDNDDNLLESSEEMEIDNYGEDKFYYFSSYSHFDYAYYEVAITAFDGVSNASILLYHFNGGIGRTYRYDKYGRVYEVIDKDNIIREYWTKNGVPISSKNILSFEDSGSLVQVIDNGLGYKTQNIKELEQYDGKGKLFYLLETYSDKVIKNKVTSHLKDTDLIDYIGLNDETYFYHYDDRKRVDKIEVKDSNGNIRKTYVYTYNNSTDFSPDELKKVQVYNSENKLIGTNTAHLTRNDSNYFNYNMYNDELLMTEKIDKYQRDIDFSVKGLKISEFEYDSVHDTYFKRQDNYYYKYNSDGLLTSIAYETNANTIATFEYDVNKNIVKITDIINNITKNFTYVSGILDEVTYKKNNVIYQKIKYVKNQKQGLKAEEYSFETEKKYIEHTSEVKETSNIHDLYAFVASKDKNIYTTFFIPKGSWGYVEEKLNCSNLFNDYLGLDSTILNTIEFFDESSIKNKGLNYINLKNNSLNYTFPSVYKDFKSFGFFINIEQGTESNEEIIYVNEYSGEKFKIYVNGKFLNIYKGNQIVKNIELSISTWYFIYFEETDEGLKGYINNEIIDGIDNLSFVDLCYLNVGYSYRGNANIYFTGLMVSETILEETFRKEVYARFKEIERIEEDTIDRDNLLRSVYARKQLHIDENQNLDYASLHSDLRTKNGMEPINTLRYDKNSNEKNFIYDNDLNSYVFNKINTLNYSLNSLESGTISFNLKRKNGSGTNFNILTIRDRSGTRFELNVSNFGLGLKVDGNSVGDSYQEDNLWHRYTISWNKAVASESMEGLPYVVKAYKDGVLISDSVGFTLSTDLNTSLTLYIANGTTSGSTLLEGLYISEGALTETEVAKLSSNNRINVVNEYNTSGNIIKKVITNKGNIVRTISYNSDELNRINAVFSNQDHSFTCDYNSQNLIVKVTNPSYSTHYSYDSLNRLLVEVNGYNGKTYNYEYGNIGNLLKVYENGTIVKSFTYDSLNRLSTYNGKSISYINGTNYTDGRFLYPSRINKTGGYVLLEWSKNRLIKYSEYNNSNVLQFEETYTYDINGLRLSKTHTTNVSGETSYSSIYYYDEQGKLIKEVRNTNSTVYVFLFFYDTDGQLECFSLNGTMYFYLRDTKQDIYAIMSSSGTIVGSYVYDAFGNILYQSGGITQINPFKYKGYYYDVETQLFYCNSRYYSPELCRWISPDSIEYLDPESINGLNLYAYCGNDPINYADPSGHAPEWWQWALLGAGVLLVVGAITVLTCGVGTSVMVGTLAGSMLHGAAIGTLIGAGVGVAGGAIIGGAVTDWSAEGIVEGMMIGFGGGAIAGAIIGATVGGIHYGWQQSVLRRAGSFSSYADEATELHHIVEQCQIKKSGFSSKLIRNSNNEVRIAKSLHSKVSSYYSSLYKSTGMRLRNYLATNHYSLGRQYNMGIKVLNMFL